MGALSLIAVDGAKNVPQGMWRAWTYMADPGTHSEARGTGFQFVSIGIALAGILLMAAILGFVVEAIQAKMDELKLGISRVVESDHSLILGWTHETVLVIEEICIANESGAAARSSSWPTGRSRAWSRSSACSSAGPRPCASV